MSRIFLTGDTHARWVSRLCRKNFPIGKELTKDDYVIICGDFGIWDGSDEEQYNLNWLNEQPWTTLFVCGNHENYDILYSYPIEEWNGGKVHRINDSVLHLMRGQIFNLGGKSFFTFGGASSHDVADGILEPDDPRVKLWNRYNNKVWREGGIMKSFRVRGKSWWPQELPTNEEMDEGIHNLKSYDWKVDYVVTHCPPTKILRELDPPYYGILYETDYLNEYLQAMANRLNYQHWYFGHMHLDEDVDEKNCCLFLNIIELDLDNRN